MGKRILIDVGVKQFYRYYCSTVANPVTSKLYAQVLDQFNIETKNLIVDGYKVYFHRGLSTFSITERKRIYRVNSVGDPILPVNWSATNKHNKDKPKEEHIRIYITDDPYYYKVTWYKYIGGVTEVYKFIPCRTFKDDIYDRIKRDPLIKLRYRNNNTQIPPWGKKS